MTYIERFQNAIRTILAWTMTLVTLLITIDVIYSLAKYLLTPPLDLQINELLNFFGSILLVLIGVELLETFKNYKQDKTFNVLIALLVALIAISRKVIIMEIEGDPNEMELIGLSALIIALSLGYYLVNRSGSIKEK
ncbi:MAG: Phosphate-starvation-inducible E [Methanosaeta sp. PtaU1.Bin112]|nr:MAG: Phosphate-starvation-inducible E [Methanosaeta sp. PtaU1.Bin112]